MDERFENFNDNDEEWLTELEIRATDLENDLFDWREAHARELAEASNGRDGVPMPEMLRAQPRQAPPRQAPPRQAPPRQAQPRPGGPRQGQPRQARPRNPLPTEEPDYFFEEEDLEPDDDLTAVIRTGARPAWPDAGRRAPSAQERTQELIDRGRRSAKRTRKPRSRKLVLGAAALALLATIAVVLIFRPHASWPASVATVQSEITTACQNPDVVSEPGQVNFACGKTTSQILWVFALMTSGNNPQFSDSKTGRQGLEPITPTQGGEVAWSLNLHHPYNPNDPVDSLEVAARAINNIIGGATLTSTSGKPAVQPGLLSNPANCVKYTGSAAIVSHAGFPALCAQPVTTATGQAALVADAYQQWIVGASQVTAYDVSVLFANASNPGNPQVQAILKTLPNVH